MQGQIASGQSAHLSGTAINNTQGQIIAATGETSLYGSGAISNQGGSVQGHTVFAQTNGALDNNGGHIQAAHNANVQAQSLNNTAGQIQAGSALQIATTGTTNNSSGQLTAGQSLSLQSGGELNNNSGRISSAGSADLLATQSLSNQSGHIVSAKAASVTASGINNASGSIHANSLSLKSKDASGNWQALHNHGGSIVAASQLQIDAGGISNSGAGRIITSQADSSMTLRSHGQDIANHASGDTGGILSAGTLNVDTRGQGSEGTLANATGYIGSGGAQRINAGAINNSGGLLTSDADMHLNSTAGISNDQSGRISVRGDLMMQAASNIRNEKSGTITSGGHTTLQVQDTLHNHGQIKGQHVRVEANALANYGEHIGQNMPQGQSDRGYIVGEETVALNVKNTIANQGGIHGKQATGISTQTLYNIGGGFIIGDQLYIKADTVHNQDDQAGKKGSALGARKELYIDAKNLNNQLGHRILSQESQLTLNVQNAVNNQGEIKAPQILIQTPTLTQHEGGYIVGDKTVALDIKNTFTNRGGVDGKEAIAILTPVLDNVGTGFVIGGELYIKADTVNNRARSCAPCMQPCMRPTTACTWCNRTSQMLRWSRPIHSSPTTKPGSAAPTCSMLWASKAMPFKSAWAMASTSSASSTSSCANSPGSGAWATTAAMTRNTAP